MKHKVIWIEEDEHNVCHQAQVALEKVWSDWQLCSRTVRSKPSTK
jgi:hypothetical protein